MLQRFGHNTSCRKKEKAVPCSTCLDYTVSSLGDQIGVEINLLTSSQTIFGNQMGAARVCL